MISENEKQNIIKLRKEGKGILEISSILKLGKATVYKWCNLFDPNKNYNLTKKISSEIKKEIINFYVQNEYNLQKTINCYSKYSKYTIREILIKSGNYITKNKKNKKEQNKTNSLTVINWKKNKRKQLIEYKGGKCKICGYNKCEQALDFHHINPKDKNFNISSNSYSFDKMKKEVDKCILLCANCHREIHAGIIKLELP